MEWIRDDRNLCHERVNKLVFINQFQTKEIKGVIRQGVISLVLGKNFVPFLTKLKKKGGERVSKIRGRGDWVS